MINKVGGDRSHRGNKGKDEQEGGRNMQADKEADKTNTEEALG